MKKNWVKSALLAGGIAALAAGTVTTVVAIRGRNTGTVIVSNVHELISAISSQPGYDTIVISRDGSPYDLGEQPSMSNLGHLVVEKGITIKGQTGRPDDVVLVGTTNRILYVKAVGCKIEGLTFKNGDCTKAMKGDDATTSSLVWGGAIFFGLASNECKIANCFFTNNAAFRGGALACARANDPTTIISGCRFVGNMAEENGGGAYNGGRMFNCLFTDNVAKKYGGGLYNGNLTQGTSARNIASKGSELYECVASRYRYGGEVSDDASRFHNVKMDRCKLCATNGYLFTGYFDVRSSTITDGRDCILTASLSVGGDRRTYVRYDGFGGTNYIENVDGYFYPRFFNCTIANNKRYKLVKPIGSPMCWVQIINCIFSGNSTSQNVGIKVNKYLATNNCYKAVDMSKAKRFVALGWRPNDGYSAFPFNTTISSPAGTVPCRAEDYGLSETNDHDWRKHTITDTMSYNIKYSESNGAEMSIGCSITYEQFFFARGWNGDTSLSSFEQKKPIEINIKAKTVSLCRKLQDWYTTNYTWDRYYRDQGWDGESDYTGGSEQDWDIGEDQGPMIGFISGSIFRAGSLPTSVYNSYWNRDNIPMKFAGEASPDNPYLISKASPASHNQFPSFGIEDVLTYSNDIDYHNELWLYNSIDLRGTPRLYGGGLDIGAYQSTVLYPLVIKIR